MTIHIEELTFECIIGILDFERLKPQKVIIDLTIDYNYNYSDDFFINYAEVITLLKEDMIKSRYELLETALNELEKRLLLNYPQIKSFTLKISKPDILNDVKVALSKTFSTT